MIPHEHVEAMSLSLSLFPSVYVVLFSTYCTTFISGADSSPLLAGLVVALDGVLDPNPAFYSGDISLGLVRTDLERSEHKDHRLELHRIDAIVAITGNIDPIALVLGEELTTG